MRVAANPAFYGVPANIAQTFYLTRPRRNGDVRRLDLTSGEEAIVADRVANWSGFAPGSDAVLFLDPGGVLRQSVPDSDTPRDLLGLPGTSGYGISLSPDGRRILRSRVEEDNTEIMLAEEGQN